MMINFPFLSPRRIPSLLPSPFSRLQVYGRSILPLAVGLSDFIDQSVPVGARGLHKRFAMRMHAQ
jgi:hypothetical protein